MHPWNYHHNLGYKHIDHLQKFPPTFLSTYHWFIILCVFNKNTSKIVVKLIEQEWNGGCQELGGGENGEVFVKVYKASVMQGD